jgi:hypothetical protein
VKKLKSLTSRTKGDLPDAMEALAVILLSLSRNGRALHARPKTLNPVILGGEKSPAVRCSEGSTRGEPSGSHSDGDRIHKSCERPLLASAGRFPSVRSIHAAAVRHWPDAHCAR